MRKTRKIEKDGIKYCIDENNKIWWCSAWEKLPDLNYIKNEWIGSGLWAHCNQYLIIDGE